MPLNPDASTHTSRVTLRLRQCAAIAVCRLPPSKSRESSASPQSPLRIHWRSPRRGTLRQTRLVFALHPSPPKTASPGSGQGCPAFRPVGRFSPVAAEPSLRKCRPIRLHERLALRRHPGSRAVAAECATPTPSLIRLRRTGGKSPRRACFVLRRRAGPCGRRRLARTGVALRAPWKDSTSPENTTNNQTHLPQDRQDRTQTLRAFPVTGQARSLRAAPVAPPPKRGVTPAARRSVHHMHRPSGLCRSLFAPKPGRKWGLRFEKFSSASTVSQSAGIPL